MLKVEVRVEHDLTVEWSIAVHMCFHQTAVDATHTFTRLSAHRPGIFNIFCCNVNLISS